MRYIVSFLLVVILSLAASEVKTGNNFLKLEYSPSYSATAGVISLFAGDGGNVNYNPADLDKVERTSLKFSYVSMVEDSKVMTFDYAKKGKNGVFGLQLSNYYMDGFEGRDDVPSDDPQWDFEYQSLVLAAGYSYFVTNNISLGLTGKFLNEKIDSDDAQGYAFSAGVNYKNAFLENLNFSLAITDFGEMNDMDKESSELPEALFAGSSYYLDFGSLGVTAALSNRYIFEDEENNLNVGLEFSYEKRFFLRSGYRSENEGRPFSVGAGFHVSHFVFDYAVTPLSDDLGTNHGVSVKYTFQ